MKYFLATQLIDHGNEPELLSIAIVAEDGREFYKALEWRDGSTEETLELTDSSAHTVIEQIAATGNLNLVGLENIRFASYEEAIAKYQLPTLHRLAKKRDRHEPDRAETLQLLKHKSNGASYWQYVVQPC
jgi:hypothetical protein